LPTVQDQPTGETPDQALEHQLRATQTQLRDVTSVLRNALAEDDRLTALANTPAADTVPGGGVSGDVVRGNEGGGW
jgi:hypothetical protein